MEGMYRGAMDSGRGLGLMCEIRHDHGSRVSQDQVQACTITVWSMSYVWFVQGF